MAASFQLTSTAGPEDSSQQARGTRKWSIGGVEVDMHHYLVLKDWDIHVDDDGQLVTLAMSDIRGSEFEN
ncbi:hypothetical protein N7478_008287 [Penicillium angulare]|uniref:uncharacterized protein n=1 Tax=Penicillium angulare TaxID=116970 RepID=UPI002540C8D4|nr:uncharacterized protein N7478_008287 [Penicillium angulare]KAJ5273162.1 hypothetical protein N7478_008287 [Penicillium angulare]